MSTAGTIRMNDVAAEFHQAHSPSPGQAFLARRKNRAHVQYEGGSNERGFGPRLGSAVLPSPRAKLAGL